MDKIFTSKIKFGNSKVAVIFALNINVFIKYPG